LLAKEAVMEFLGAVYGIEPIEYPERGGRSLLVCAGTGLMLALMDQCRHMRWCLDVDGLTVAQRARFSDWLVCAEKRTDLIAFAGWHCATDPAPIAQALARLDRRGPCYAQCHGPGADPFKGLATARELAAFIDQVNGCTESTGTLL
jgi:hypothetical protein